MPEKAEQGRIHIVRTNRVLKQDKSFQSKPLIIFTNVIDIK